MDSEEDGQGMSRRGTYRDACIVGVDLLFDPYRWFGVKSLDELKQVMGYTFIQRVFSVLASKGECFFLPGASTVVKSSSTRLLPTANI